jgi:hypothetical protein
MQGIANLTDDEAAHIVGEDRESHQRSLFAGGRLSARTPDSSNAGPSPLQRVTMTQRGG